MNTHRKDLRFPACALVVLTLIMSMLFLVAPDTAAAQDNTGCKGELVDGVCTIDDGPVCPDGFVVELLFGTQLTCRWQADPVVTIQCPDGARGQVGDCYVIVPKQRQDSFCEVGTMAGQHCVEVGPAPIVTRAGLVCMPGYGLVQNTCLRYSAATPGEALCPEGAVEDAIGHCRVSVEPIKLISCEEPAGANFVSDLIDNVCVFAMPADCGAAVFDGVDRCVLELPERWCDGVLVTINMELGASGIGTPGDDVIWGTNGADTILAGAGDDIVCAGDGDDVVLGGPGTNRLFGQGGNDGIRGGVETDFIVGGSGDDWLQGNSGDDHLIGGDGENKVDGMAGNDRCQADPNRDKIRRCETVIS